MTVVQVLGRGWGEVVEVVVGSLVVEPVDPAEGLDLDVVDVAPWSAPVDQLGLVGADRGLGQGVVIRVAD